MSLSVKQICELIKVSGEAKVKELKFLDLHVFFAPQGPVAAIQSTEQSGFALTHGKEIETEESVIKLDVERLRQERLDMALIEDPVEYERLVLAGESEDGQTA